MAKLIIRRTSEWNNRIRDIGIYLNGRKIGVIGNGQVKEFELEPDEHQLRAKIDWCGSKTLAFTVTDRDVHKIELSGFKLGKWLMPIAVIVGVVYFTFGQLLSIEPIGFLLIAGSVLAYLLYHLTFGRNNYLRLKEL